MLAAGRKNISSVKSEDVEIGSMGRNGQLTGVEQLVLQKGNELAVTDLTIYGGSSLTITLGSTFSFAGTVDLVDSGFVLNGGNSYLYGAGTVTVDLSGREEGKAYKLVAYTGAGDADFSFVTVDADTVEFNNSLYLADADRRPSTSGWIIRKKMRWKKASSSAIMRSTVSIRPSAKPLPGRIRL